MQKTARLRKEAQQEALTRLAPKVALLAALEDPVTAALRDNTPPRMPPLQSADRATLRSALEAAEREASGLIPRLLEPADRVLALASGSPSTGLATPTFAVPRGRTIRRG
ncbi:MAG: hypothetical protein KUG77_22385 [Nannocystaceae bacterium]|nr:hypothetical protein [Nannocystaceae bacterium]